MTSTTSSPSTPRIVRRKKGTNTSRRMSGQVSRSVRNYYARQCELLRGVLPENPVKEYRHNKNLTLAQLADMVGISEHALIRTEQGFYPSLSSALTAELGTRAADRYNDWQQTVRRQHYRVFGDIANTKFVSDNHPLDTLYQQWCITDTDPTGKCYYTPVGSKLNDTEVCKLLCLNQSVINYWHNRSNSQKTVPTQFLEALHVNGYSDMELALVASAYSEYQNYLRGAEPTVVQTYKGFLEQVKEALNGEPDEFSE